MNDLRKSFTATGYNLYYSISNPKIWAALVLILTTVFVDYSGYILMIADFDLPVSIGIISGLFIDPFFVMVAFTGLLLIFSEMPFNDPQQVFMITRCGKRAWCISQILYIIAVSLFVMLSIFIFTMIIFAGHLIFDDSWGRIIPSANSGEVIAKYPIRLSINSYIISFLTPQEALIYSVPTALFTFVTFGCLIFALNTMSRKIAGTIIGAVFVAENWIAVYLPYNWVPWVTMLGWCSLNRINFAHTGTNPAPEHAYIMLSVIFVLSVAVVLFRSRKKIDVL